MKPVVLSQSMSLVLAQVEHALEVWFGKEFCLVDSELSVLGSGTVETGTRGQMLALKRRISVKARFREKGQTELLKVACILTVKFVSITERTDIPDPIYQEWWFVEQKPTPININGRDYVAEWEEPRSSTFDLINATVSDPSTGLSWTGLAHNERWPTKKEKKVT